MSILFCVLHCIILEHKTLPGRFVGRTIYVCGGGSLVFLCHIISLKRITPCRLNFAIRPNVTGDTFSIVYALRVTVALVTTHARMQGLPTPGVTILTLISTRFLRGAWQPDRKRIHSAFAVLKVALLDTDVFELRQYVFTS